MKTKILTPLFAFSALAILLTGCAEGLAPGSWPGIAVDETTAYVAAGAQFYAVDLVEHEDIWRFPDTSGQTKAYYAAPVLTGDGQLIVSGYDYILYSLEPESGRINWQFEEGRDRYIGSVLVADDMIYAPNADYNLYALNLDGERQWKFEAGQSLWSAPVIEGRTIFFGSLDRNVYALEADSGSLVWQTPLTAAILCSPASAEGLPLFVAAFDGALYALDKRDGSVLWQSSFAGRLWSSPVLFDGVLYIGDDSGALAALDAATGDEIWSTDTGSPILGSPLVTPEAVYFNTEAGDLYAYSLAGEELWQEDVVRAEKTYLYGTPVLAGGEILLAPVGGENVLLAFDQAGNDAWEFIPEKK
ncbi:MAG: PQQ-like beta-propeller repeat protein [Chloroflexi bacterium]|nr:PQQ-like beta-propeller repeat protein [Chloroflexota bacterium]